ncbi:MAG TPA: S8 family serine peptidase [Pyrinomonadaceae bacterium]|nr:S8 family serine peptidase [Pyrinomonadaceae bacterium]
MASVWDKIDSGLAIIYENFLRVRDRGAANVADVHPVVAEGGKLHVSLRYRGDLAPAESAGFETVWTDGKGQATGSLRLEDLQSIADQPEVVTIRYGTEPQVELDVSVPQIKANQIWTLGSSGTFSGQTGAGILIGVIDTGVDIHHKFLWKQTIPNNKTRILRIWDMGLIKTGAESSPDVALLDAGTPGTYGVEYTEKQINDVIQGVAGAMPIRHRDCSSHGTHVASTAAGDGRFKFKLVGVAPRADLVIVKLLHLENEPKVGATTVSFDQRVKDAVTYIRKLADELAKPAVKPLVINYSIGNSLGPHDGLTEQEDWLDNEFRDAASAGKIFVVSAGNSAGKRQHARIEFTAARLVIDVPFELFDSRVTFKEDDSCTSKSTTKTLLIDFYYPNGGATLTGELKPEGEASFTAGPAVGGGPVSGSFSGRNFTMLHSVDTDSLISGTVIRRNEFLVSVQPHSVNKHLTGTYRVRLKASAPMTVHAWCFQYRKHGLRLAPDPLPAGVTAEDKFLVNSPGSATNLITVAAYEPNAPLDVAKFSSRGPLARHGVGGAAPAKPDIGAPGVGIKAARSRDSSITPAIESTSMQGTSMAAPHVAGAIALMLQKSATLTPSQARAKLQANALKTPAPVADEIGGGRLDAKKTFDNTP